MARIRSIKPEFFTSLTIADQTLSARLTFIGLWTYVDDNGVGLADARLIRAAVWPLEETPEILQRTREDLQRLHAARLITLYTSSGKALVAVSAWDEHQKISHPRKPRFPRPTPGQIGGDDPSGQGSYERREPSGNSPEDYQSPPDILRPEQGSGSRDQGVFDVGTRSARPRPGARPNRRRTDLPAPRRPHRRQRRQPPDDHQGVAHRRPPDARQRRPQRRAGTRRDRLVPGLRILAGQHPQPAEAAREVRDPAAPGHPPRRRRQRRPHRRRPPLHRRPARRSRLRPRARTRRRGRPMNRSEAALLLARAAAFDNRTVGRVDAEAWAAALNDVPFDDDATAAVARFYGTPPKDPSTRLWIQPHNVRSLRKTIRSERAEGFRYEPPALDETPREFLARYRGQLDAVASGRVTAPAGRLALEGGPHPAFTRELEARGYQVGRTVPSTDEQAAIATVRRAGPLGVDCPACGAVMGRPCRTPGGTDKQPLGKPRQRPHTARQRAAAGEGDLTPERRAADEQRRREASRRALARIEETEAS